MPKPPMFVIVAAGLGVLLGLVAGDATVGDLRSDLVATERLAGAYGVPVKVDPFASPVEAATAREAIPMPADDPAGCIACSDWEMGYRWAEQRALSHAAACRVDSWSFQRGCEAAIRDRAAPIL